MELLVNMTKQTEFPTMRGKARPNRRQKSMKQEYSFTLVDMTSSSPSKLLHFWEQL